MWMLHRSHVGVLALVILVPACSDSNGPVAPPGAAGSQEPSFTIGSGVAATTLSRTTFSDPADQVFKVKRISGDWHFEIKSTPALDLAVQSIAFAAGSQSGWHSHPGPVFVQVVSGTVTFYESDDPTCTGVVRTQGQEYLDHGGHAHIARNETAGPAQVIATYFAPPGAALRIDEPAPGSCAF
jgi:hypothetical protein